MWTSATHERLAEHRIPEIMEADLASLVLDMAKWGVSDISQLTWLTPPPANSLSQASETLHQVNALENGKITEHGKQIHALISRGSRAPSRSACRRGVRRSSPT